MLNEWIFIYLFYLRLPWVFIAVQASSSLGRWGLLSSGSARASLLIVGLPLLQSTGSRAHGLQQSWCKHLVALRAVESSQMRDRTYVPCIGRRIPNHGTTRKARGPGLVFIAPRWLLETEALMGRACPSSSWLIPGSPRTWLYLENRAFREVEKVYWGC